MILNKIYREEWEGLVEKAEFNLNSDCPLIEDETIIKVDDYMEQLEAQIPQWIDINLVQPNDYREVLFYCEGGKMLTGRYYGEQNCKSLPSSHGMFGKSRKWYGKYGRYCEPAGRGYKVTHWMPLPNEPEVKE